MTDVYKTIAGPSEGLFKAKGSKFFAYAYPVETEEEVATFVKTQQQLHFKARHHCYAYRIGQSGNRWRANDDGEPSNSAGKPILGQLDSAQLINVLVIVVRYFGGVKLGVSGLIEAYREATADALAHAQIEERIFKQTLLIQTDYAHLSNLMEAIKGGEWEVVSNEMHADVKLTLNHRVATFEEAFRELWLVLAKAYPGEEKLDENPPGYVVKRLS